MATQTTTIEMAPIPSPPSLTEPAKAALPPSSSSLKISSKPDTSDPSDSLSPSSDDGGGGLEAATPPPEAVDELPRWNSPKSNTYKLLSIFYAFINFGMNDASYGPLLPYIQEDYHTNYTVTSLVFLSPFVGYIIAALTADRLHMLVGRRGMALISPLSRLLAYIVISTHPPFPVVIAIFACAGLGNGFLDGAWNAWVGEMAQATQIMGLLHGCYGVGAVIAPSIATAMITKYGCEWYQFFFVMIGVVTVEAGVCGWAFWKDDAKAYKARTRKGEDSDEKGMTRRAMKGRTTWVTAMFMLVYMGVEVSTGGYIVIFMTEVRHGKPFPSGLTATGFWLGLTAGRIILGFITPKIGGERLAVVIYLACALGVELLFWLVPQFIVSAIAIALVGFFIGPFFPAAVMMAAKLLPTELHVAAIGFASALGGGGAAILPFVVGTVVEASGVKTLQPLILAFLAIMLGIWFCYPKVPKHSHHA